MDAATDGLSLYFRLRPGEKADLEIVAAAALAWVDGLRATARAIDPDAEIRVELIDADESSLRLNTLIEWWETNVEKRLERVDRGGQKLPRTKKLALALGAFLVFTGPQTYDFYFGDEKFTEEDRKKVDELLAIAKEDKEVTAARRRFYSTIEREPAITDVGVQEAPDAPPIVMMPSTMFAEGGGLWYAGEETVKERITRPVVDVVLVKPALVHTPRAWTFKPDGLPEFEAVMRDPEVLEAMRTGLPQSMREGINMRVRLEVKEVLVDGQWKLVRGGRSVTKVLTPSVRP